ncbi:DUF732 domain-containing protein, partial [Mycobacterium simiae]
MFTGIAHHMGTLVSAITVLTGAAILSGGAAAADPNQDEQFLALLESKEIPALANVPSVIETAHKICHKLDGGAPLHELVEAMRDTAFNIDSSARLYAPARVTTTIHRFITAAVEAYCPHHQGDVATITAYRVRASNEHLLPAFPLTAVNSGRDPVGHVRVSLMGEVSAGDTVPADPSPILVPPPP